MFRVGDLRISSNMFRLFLAGVCLAVLLAAFAGVLICSLCTSVLAPGFSPPTTTEGTVSPSVHAGNEGHSDQDRAGPRYYYIAIQNNRPEEGQ